jgi:hypothetical protein
MKKPTLITLALFAVSVTSASPRIDSNSIVNRHDMLIIRDSDTIQGAVLAWPWPLGRSAFGESKIEDFGLKQSSGRLNALYEQKSELGLQPTTVEVAFGTDRLPFRSFGYQPREAFQTSVSSSWLGEWTAGNIQLSFVDDPSDGDEFRLDGSYLSVALGNWVAAIDQVERWWGPGWDGSLILSNNSRPIPALSLTRISPDAFNSKFLKWIGPWTFTTCMGQLDNDEGERPGSDALLFGMRIDFSPFGWDWLDIGLNRTAQWSGDGRPGDLDTFWRLLLGEDNRVNGVTLENEPGNQLAGVDYRLKLKGWNLAQYGQVVGEDEETFLPDANMLLFGVEHWGELQSLNASWRIYYEWADTRAGYLLADPDSGARRNRAFNIAYNHSIYRSGYRDKGRSIGHAMDGDGLMRSIGAFIVKDNGDLYGLKLRDYAINRDGRGPNSVSIDPLDGNSIEFFGESDLPIFQSSNLRIRLGIHYINESNRKTGETYNDFGGTLSLSKQL